MSLTIKEAARFLGVSENRIRRFIADGRLTVERKGRQVLIPQTALEALAEGQSNHEGEEREAGRQEPAMVPPAASNDVLSLLGARLAALEEQFTEKLQMVAENQRLHELLREQDRQVAAKDLELEKLHRDLTYQQRLAQKELEDHRQACQDCLTRLEREAATRAAQERERAEEALAKERQSWTEKLTRQEQNWTEKLAQEQERFARMLAAMRNQEGFWARLIRMITWS